MPLRDGDIQILSIEQRSKPGMGGKLTTYEEITFSVRGGDPRRVYVEAEHYTFSIGQQAVLKAASEIADLLDAYPIQE